MTLLSSIGLAPRPTPTPTAPSQEPTQTSGSGTTTGTSSSSDLSGTSTNTQNTSTDGGGGIAQTSEPGVTYKPLPPKIEAITYSPTSSASQPAAAPIASTPEVAPARFSISSGPSGTITEQTASILAAGRPEQGPAQPQDVARPDIAELVAAFTAQFAGSERRNLETLL